MLISEAFPTKWLSSADLKGQCVMVTIVHVMAERVDIDAGDTKPILSFQNAKKSLVLNKINANTIVKLYGDDTDRWVGQKIELYPALTEYKGETVDCIRVRGPVLPSAAVQAPLTQPQSAPATPVAGGATGAEVRVETAVPQSQPAADAVAGLDLDDTIPF